MLFRSPPPRRRTRRPSARLAAGALTDAGYAVEEVEPPDVAGAAQLWTELLSVDLRGLEPLMGNVMGEDAQAFLRASLDAMPSLDLPAYAGVFIRREAMLRAWSGFLERHPILLAPLYTSRPFVPRSDLEDGRVGDIQIGRASCRERV